MRKPKRPPPPPNPSPKSKKTNPATAEKLKAFLSTKGIDESKASFLPLYTRNEDMAVVLDRETGKILSIAPVVP